MKTYVEPMPESDTRVPGMSDLCREEPDKYQYLSLLANNIL